jgi:hypothetical protein
VLKGTAVDVTLSRQTQLKVLVNPANPARGGNVLFHAHLEPLEKGMRYRFFFGDHTNSGWLPTSNTNHIYQQGGNFQVYAIATRGLTTIKSQEVTITIPLFPWSLTAALGAGMLILAGAGDYYHRWRQFQRWIKVAPEMDRGIQRVSVETSAAPSPPARIRAIHDPGRSTIEVKEGSKEGKVKI